MKYIARQERIFGHETRYCEEIVNGVVIDGWTEEKNGDEWVRLE